MTWFNPDIKNMTLQEVVEETRSVDIYDGGLNFMILKLVMEIEELKDNIKCINRRIDRLEGYDP